MIQKVTGIVVITLFICLSLNIGKAQSPKTIDILFIGHCYTYGNGGLDKHFEALASSANPPLFIEADIHAEGNATLKILWNGIAAREVIKTGGFQFVIMQGDIRKSGVDTFHEYARMFVGEIEESGAEAVLFMAWDTPKIFTAGFITMEEIAHAHNEIAQELDLKVAPVGLAMYRAMEERPDMGFIRADFSRPTIKLTYLATCIIYATILDKSPIGLPYVPSEQGGVTEEEAIFLQRIAWETVQDYKVQQ
jgi:hypothetical protein